MASRPYYTSRDLVEAVKRKISFPISQNTFSSDDILKFANEEMMLSQVPDILKFQEEYFVYRYKTPLLNNKNRYAIPSRAIGMKLRDLMWTDQEGNFFEMTRVNDGDKAFFQRNVGANQAVHKFYMEGNEVVLTPLSLTNPTGDLNFFIFLRPNQLVDDSRAAIIKNFVSSCTVDFNTLAPGNRLKINSEQFIAINALTNPVLSIGLGKSPLISVTNPHYLQQGDIVTLSATDCSPIVDGNYVVESTPSATEFTISLDFDVTVAGTTGSMTNPNYFEIDTNSVVTATNLATTINLNGVVSANNGTPSTSVVTLRYSDLATTFSSTSNSLILETRQGFEFDSIPTNITAGKFVDFLQTEPGHRTYTFDIQALEVTGAIAYFNKQAFFDNRGVPLSIILGDYICEKNECIIPQIPPELHNGLAERVCARILSAIGDQTGLAVTNQKLADIKTMEGMLVDDRVDNAPLKVLNRYSLLRLGKMGTRRRY